MTLAAPALLVVRFREICTDGEVAMYDMAERLRLAMAGATGGVVTGGVVTGGVVTGGGVTGGDGTGGVVTGGVVTGGVATGG